MTRDPLDYAPHTLAADFGLRRMRKLLLEKKYDEASDEANNIIAEMRLAKAAIKDIKEHLR
jgi:hypothetical protein